MKAMRNGRRSMTVRAANHYRLEASGPCVCLERRGDQIRPRSRRRRVHRGEEQRAGSAVGQVRMTVSTLRRARWLVRRSLRVFFAVLAVWVMAFAQANAADPNTTFWSVYIDDDKLGGVVEAYRYDPRGTVRLYLRCGRGDSDSRFAVQATVVVPKKVEPTMASARISSLIISSEKLDQPAILFGEVRPWHDDSALTFDFSSDREEGRRLVAFVYERHAANFLARPLPPESSRDAYRRETLELTLQGDALQVGLTFKLAGSGSITKLGDACGII